MKIFNTPTLLSALATFALLPSAQASDLKECQAKIASLLNRVKIEIAKGPAAGKTTERYHLSADKSCGVEYLPETAQLTVTRFGADESADLEKFETILMSEAELTSGGRVRATLECEIDGDSVTYETRLPIFSDGVRTWKQEKLLSVSIEDRTVWVELKSKVQFFASKIRCGMEF